MIKTCERCGRLFHTDDDERSQCHICDEIVRGAEFRPFPIFCRMIGGMPVKEQCVPVGCERSCAPPNNKELFLGVELEVDVKEKNYGSHKKYKKMTKDLFDIIRRNGGFYLKTDGTIPAGVEIVTDPMSLEYHTNAFCWEEIANAISKNGIANSNCGMHIHVNNSFFSDRALGVSLARVKLIRLFCLLWGELVNYSGREVFTWCGKNDEPKTIHDLFNHIYGKHRAINVEPKHSTEIRLWGGTTDYKKILSFIKTTDNICRFVKESSIQKILNTDRNTMLCLIDGGV